MRGLSGLALLLIFSSTAYCSVDEQDGLSTEITAALYHPESSNQPYLDTDAEKWAFDLQMARILKESQAKIQEEARNFILKREQNHARIPDQTVPVVVKSPEQDHDYKLFLRDGVINGLEEITFIFEKILFYEDVDVVFSGEVKYPKGLKVIQSFISTNDTIIGNGKTTGFVEKLNFNFKASLNLKVGNLALEYFERNCQSNVKVNFEGRGPMELQLIQIITRSVKELITGGVLRDVQKLTLTAMENAFKRMKGNIELPHYDYGKNYTNFDYLGHKFRPNTTRCSKKSKNPTVMQATIRTSGVGTNYPENLPFIQNDPEMRSFFDQLRNGTNKYLNGVFEKTTKTLRHRGLQRAKLTDIERTFITEDSSVANPVGNLKISNGWITDITNFSRGGMDLVYIDETEVQISARLHLSSKIESMLVVVILSLISYVPTSPYVSMPPKYLKLYAECFRHLQVNQAFHLDLENYKGAGGLRGTTDYMIYMAKILVNLTTFETSLLDFYLVCIGNVKYQVAVIETKDSSYESGLLRAAVDTFNHSVSNEIGKLIRHGLEYAISKIDVKEYLPPWDYSRVCDRKGNLDPKYRMCGKADMTLALRKKHGNDHRARIKSSPVHFINTELELQSFGEQLVVGMNNYLKEMINEASRIITLQDLKKIRFKYYVRPWNAKDPTGMYKFGTVSIFGGVLGDLSVMYKGTNLIDDLVFDDHSIVINAQIPFWWTLKFQANVSIIQDKKYVPTQIKGELSSLIYFIKIRVDYSKKVTIEEFRVECLGDGKFSTKFSYNDNWMRESLMEQFNGFLAQHIWPEANQILKRSFEDAVNSSNVSTFLPDKNYAHINLEGLPEKAKYWKNFDSCSEAAQQIPTIGSNLETIEVVEFEKILPLMKTETLRRNLDNELRKNSQYYLNHLWSLTKDRLSKELAFGGPPIKRISFYPEGLGGEQEAILELGNGWFKVFTKSDSPPLQVRDNAYGENSTFIILLTEDIEMFKVSQNFTLQVADERVNGSIIMSAEGIRNLVAARFFILSNHLEILDYDFFCLNQTIASISGLPNEYQGLRTAIMAEIIKASLIPLYKDYLVEVWDAFDAVDKTDKNFFPYLPEYVVEKHLFGVAVYHDPDLERQIKRNRDAIQCHMEEEPDILEKMVHMIKSPPEDKLLHLSSLALKSNVICQIFSTYKTRPDDRFFSKLLINSMNSLKTDLDFSSLKYVIINDLDGVKIPDISGEVNLENTHGVKVPTTFSASNGTMVYLFKSLTPEKIYYDEGANEVVLLSYLNFKNTIKLRYNILVNSIVADESGEIDGDVQELVYSFKVHVNVNEKHFRLESLHLKCVKGITMVLNGISSNSPQLVEHISKSLRKTFMTTILDDLEKYLTIALLDRVMQLNREDNGNFYLPEWNYDKDYGDSLSSESDEDVNICPTKLNFFKGPDGLLYYSE